MDRIDANGLELWVDRQGSGPPVALLPGGPGLAADYLEPVAALLEEVYTVFRVDPRGCGRSDHADTYEVGDFIADFEGVRSSLGFERWTVVGHSFGADLALAYAIEARESVDRVVAISPTGVQDSRGWHREYEQGKSAGQDPLPTTSYPVRPDVQAAAVASWRRWITRPLLLRRIKGLATPYRAVVGSRDVRPSWPVEQVVALMPRGELIAIDEAGHQPWTTHPRQLRAALLAAAAE